MVGPNKILTVSYGTFSCTLEGFDDPFSTMRGIAEYFRDLAADDRYFGAEPPTPDAEMLHRIAEREVQRRVEARVGPDGIVLRQAEDRDAPAIAAEEGEGEDDIAAEPAAAEPAESKDEPEWFTPEPVAPAAGPGSVAERLARIRAVVAQTSGDEPDVEDDGHYAADLTEAVTGDAEAQEDTAPDFIAEAEPEPLAEEEEVAATAEADMPAEETVDEPQAAAEFDEPDAAQAEDAIAAWDAELTEHGETAGPETEAPEPTPEIEAEFDADEFAAALADEPEAEEEEVPVDHVEALAPVIAEDTGNGFEEEETAEDIDLGAILATDEAEEEATTAAPEAAEEDAAALQEQEEADDIDFGAILATDKDAPDQAHAGADEAEEAEAEDEPHIARAFEASDFAALVAAESAAVEAEQAAQADEEQPDDESVQRLIRMRRADFQAHVEATAFIDEAAEADLEPAAELAEDIEAETSLSEDEEAELLAELARVEAEAADTEETEAETEAVDEADAAEAEEEDTHQAVAEAEEEEDAPQAVAEAEEQDAGVAEVAPSRPSRPVSRPENLKAEGTNVRHILDVTNHEMEESEGSRRRSAIAHLKAAVAATRADQEAEDDQTAGDQPSEEDGDDIEAYREDLARAVKPRRLAQVARSISRRLPPLMLVSEQRIDQPQDAPEATDPADAATIRPRRVAASLDQDDDDDTADNIFSEAGSFAEFAREMGASELPDLLEAAAAYYHYVEGQPHFSRPQIMSAVAAMEGDEFSREDSLRSFGQLLRRGKIRKIRRGQFEINDDTRFRPQLQAGE